MNWYVEVLKKYAVFEGRAGRSEYWYFVLFNFIISVVLSLIDHFTGTYSNTFDMGLLGSLYSLAVLVPALAVTARRLHDTGRSGWWMFISLVPLIGVIALIYFTVQDSDPGDNAYGPKPR